MHTAADRETSPGGHWQCGSVGGAPHQVCRDLLAQLNKAADIMPMPGRGRNEEGKWVGDFSYRYVLGSSDVQKVENVCAGHSRKKKAVYCGGRAEILTALPCPVLLCSVQSHFVLPCLVWPCLTLPAPPYHGSVRVLAAWPCSWAGEGLGHRLLTL